MTDKVITIEDLISGKAKNVDLHWVHGYGGDTLILYDNDDIVSVTDYGFFNKERKPGLALFHIISKDINVKRHYDKEARDRDDAIRIIMLEEYDTMKDQYDK